MHPDHNRASDGGRAALRKALPIVFLVVIAWTTAEGTLYLLYSPYLAGYGYTLSSIGALYSLFALLRLTSRVPVGMAYRPARAKVQIATSLAALAFTTGGFAVVRGNPVAIALLTLAQGFAVGAVGTLLFAAVIDLTRGRYAAALMGWYTAALSTGYSLGAFAGGWLGDTLGAPLAFVVAGALPLASVLAILALPPVGEPGPHRTRISGVSGLVLAAAKLDVRVWLAFAMMVYINGLHDSVDTFFPLFALSVGLPLTAIGVLKGLKSVGSTAIRFVSGIALYYLDYRSINVWAIILAAVAAFFVPWFSGFGAFAALFVAAGLARGILRVTSAAMVAELRGEGQDIGLASGIYSSGLDLGGIVGPAVGGVLGNVLGLPAMFQILALSSVVAYFAVVLSSAAGRASLRFGFRAPAHRPPSGLHSRNPVIRREGNGGGK